MEHARGLVEGFYGRPYTPEQRRGLLGQLSLLRRPVYLYAPKSDPWHRARWREPYPAESWNGVADLMEAGRELGVEVVFGLSPLRARPGEGGPLGRKLRRAVDAGASGVAVLFDDQVESADAALADLHLEVAAEAAGGLDVPVTVCPAAYCTELVRTMDGGQYLRRMAEGLPRGWEMLWTGSEVVSRTLAADDLTVPGLPRPPLVWDNLLADDYCLRRIYLAPLAGRVPSGCGYLVNPSSVFPVALHAAWRLARACGADPAWPSGLGREKEGWRVMAAFHHTPWELTPEGREMVEDLVRRLRTGGGVPDWLEPALEAVRRLTEDLPGLSGGFDLLPHAVDLRRMLSIASVSLSEHDHGMLRYLLEKRLPYEHPLARALARTAEAQGRGE
jgi:hypothetical protein